MSGAPQVDARFGELAAKYHAMGCLFPEALARMEISTGKPVEVLVFSLERKGVPPFVEPWVRRDRELKPENATAAQGSLFGGA